MATDDRIDDLLAVFDKHDLPAMRGYVHVVYLCPGCAAWQVEVTRPMVDQAPATTGASFAALGAMVELVASRQAVGELVSAHRAGCAGLDMLAGLKGVPPESDRP